MEWIKCSEELPELNDEYNVVWNFDGDPVVTTMEYENGKWIDKAGFCDSDCTDEFTHWMPLPELPTETLTERV